MPPTMSEAMTAIGEGNKTRAMDLLAGIVRNDPDNERAWLLLSHVLEDYDKKRQCLERVLHINPSSREAAQQLADLQGEPSPQSPEPEPPSSATRSVESVQCPKCGAPIADVSGRDSIHCTYCGAKLRITRGASGHAMATLDDIKVDTSTLAKEATYSRLRTDLAALERNLGNVKAARHQARDEWAKSNLNWSHYVVLALVAIVGTTACMAGLVAPHKPILVIIVVVAVSMGVPLLVAGIVRAAADSRKKRMEARFARQIGELESEIDRTEQHMAKIRAEMDNVTGHLVE